MFTQVRTHFTFITPRLIVHTCSEDCSEVTKYFFCPPLQNFLLFLAELEIRGLPAWKGPTNRERNLGCDHARQIAFCADTKSCPVSYEHLSDMWLFTLRDPRGASSLRYRNRTEISVLICEQKPYPLWFLCWRKSCPVLCKHSLRLSDGRQNTPRIWKVDQLYQMVGVTKHAKRIVFFF